jgi:sec-independent protein translocase protein TatA
MFNLGTKEIVIIAVVLVLLFGAKKIPQLADGIGEAIRKLRKGFTDDVSDEKGKK